MGWIVKSKKIELESCWKKMWEMNEGRKKKGNGRKVVVGKKKED